MSTIQEQSPTNSVETIRVSWGSDNDGPGSTLDADLLDGKSSEDFLQASADFDVDLMVLPGTYSGLLLNVPTSPQPANPYATVIVIKGTDSDLVSQILVDNDNKMFNRTGSGDPFEWESWGQMGTMTFDAVSAALYITL